MTAQLTLTLEPGATARHRTLKDCIAQGVYQRGVVAVAGKIDASPSHLSEALSSSERRKFDVDDFERYIQSTGDTAPILYLAARHLQDAATVQQQAMSQLPGVLAQLQTLLAVAGAPAPKGKR